MPIIFIKKNSDGVSAFLFFKLAGRIMLGPNNHF